VKQLLIKLLVGPKDASTMAFGILCKVLKFTADEAKLCENKIKWIFIYKVIIKSFF